MISPDTISRLHACEAEAALNDGFLEGRNGIELLPVVGVDRECAAIAEARVRFRNNSLNSYGTELGNPVWEVVEIARIPPKRWFSANYSSRDFAVQRI
jgi:hypothetical protein